MPHEESGLYYHGARYYAPWLSRWTAADPAGMVDGPNLYQYVRGNPVRLVDPDGREASAAIEEAIERTAEATKKIEAAASYEARSNASFGTRLAEAGRIVAEGIVGGTLGTLRGLVYHVGGLARAVGRFGDEGWDKDVRDAFVNHGGGLLAAIFGPVMVLTSIVLAVSVLVGSVPVSRELTEQEADAMKEVYSGQLDVSTIRVHELEGTWLKGLVGGDDGKNWMVYGTRIFSPEGGAEMGDNLSVHEGGHVWRFGRVGPGYLIQAGVEHLIHGDDVYELEKRGILEDRVEFHSLLPEAQAEFLEEAYKRGIFKDLEEIPEEGRDAWSPRWHEHDSISEYYYFLEAVRDFQRTSPW